MINDRKILAIIPARGGSKGLPRKNILPVLGMPLIAWTIKEAKQSKYIDRIILSSEDEEIINVAKEWGCEVPFIRPDYLAADESETMATILHAMNFLSQKYDYLVLLQPTSPLRRSDDIDRCIELCVNENAPACVSATEVDENPYLMFKINEDGHMTPIFDTTGLKSRPQSLPVFHILNEAVYVAKWSWLLKEKTFLHRDSLVDVMPRERSVYIANNFDFNIFKTIVENDDWIKDGANLNSITTARLERLFLRIEKLVKEKLVAEAHKEYAAFADQIRANNDVSHDIKAKLYSSFAYFLFSKGNYEESIRMFLEAQTHGYSKEEIKKVIFEAFISPNLAEFQAAYNDNIDFLITNKRISRALEFNALNYWLITTAIEDEYFMYDKQNKLIGEKCNFSADNNKLGSLLVTDEFADFIVVEDWNLSVVNQYINAVNQLNRKCYVVINNMNKFLSCFQSASIAKNNMGEVLIFDGLAEMREYFSNCSAYLPRNIINLTDTAQQVKNTMDEIHRGRIRKSEKCRRRDNILLSICIPSYNRGNRAYDNVIHNLQCYYDEEIEIVLSNNGTQNASKDYYDKISKIDDSRLTYFSFQENQDFAPNICKVCEIAQGKFLLLLSDEDLVNLQVLPKLMSILRNSEDSLAIVRTKGDKQGFVPSFKLAEAGEDALLTYMLTSNYMSGMVLNNGLLKQHNGIEYVKSHLDNEACLYYPHMFFELLLCQYRSVQGLDIVLINEGEAEKEITGPVDTAINPRKSVPLYATLEGRLDQHKGFVNIFKDLDVCQKDFSTFMKMYTHLSFKTLFLVSLSIKVFYEDTDIDSLSLLDTTYRTLLAYLDEFYLERSAVDKKNYKRNYIKYYERYHNDYCKELKSYYKNIKQQIQNR